MRRFVLIIAVLMLFVIPFSSAEASVPAPKINSAVLSEDLTIDVSWSKAADAKGYAIYRATSKNGKYVKIGTASSKARYFTDKNCKVHKTYWYKVKATNGSKYSNKTSCYVSNDYYENKNVEFEIRFDEGDVCRRKGGDGITTNSEHVTITPYKSGKKVTDYSVYCDKGSLKVKKLSSGSLDVSVLKPGYHILTFKIDGEPVTIVYNAEWGKAGDDYLFSWKQSNEFRSAGDCKYPATKDTVLNIYRNGSKVTGFSASSSNTAIAKASVKNGDLLVENMRPGMCTITVTKGTHKVKTKWIVSRTATGKKANGVPVSSVVFAPEINGAVVSDDLTVDVSWDKAVNAKGYAIYRATSDNGEYEKIGTASSSARYFTDKTCEKNETYWYKVKATNGSKYSENTSCYVSKDYFENSNIRFEIKYDGGEVSYSNAGDNFSTNGGHIIITPFRNGNKVTDYTVDYDKGSLEVNKLSDNRLDVSVLKPGCHILTFKIDGNYATLGYNAEWGEAGSYYMFSWRQNSQLTSAGVCKYPNTKNSVLNIYRDGKRVTGFNASSSNTSIAKVSVKNGDLLVENMKPGICTITVTKGEHSVKTKWIVSRSSLEKNSVYGVPVSHKLSSDKAKKVIDMISASDYSVEEIESMSKNATELSYWQDKLSKPADIINMLRVLEFNKVMQGKIDNIDLKYNNRYWGSKLSPSENYKQRFVVCLSISEMMNYLLRDDMEEQGYVHYSSPGGGHAFCYYKINGLYVFCDFTDAPAIEGYSFTDSIVYITDDKNDFTKFYLNSDPEYTVEKSSGYIYMLYMYPMEGRAIPGASTGTAYAKKNCIVGDIFPAMWNGKEVKDILTMLYTAPGFEYTFTDGPPNDLYPE